ncbi:methyl-accepting chemotaxis protein [Roseateles oligotrophus]|uniref:Methyl-accepting chemotaxis protein n=1 Tax=Roseateles oligotrophus TaxID=1769250 RepID=A0ABT2YC68_9BURK|nr:methyl-accepting chemotaxis protein [Roseateles oligotrophus]MCV2367621.1 methyl-accepting chemotaxis protein [Roseateles oligotrophus]
MNSLKPSRQLSIRTLLSIIGMIAMLLGLLPSSLLVQQYTKELDLVERETIGLSLNEKWHEILQSLQTHRSLSVESLSIRPDAAKELADNRQSTRNAIEQLKLLLVGQLDGRHAEAAKTLAEHLELLGADLDGRKLDVAKLLNRQQALSAEAFRAIAELNGDSGLLFDADEASYFAIMAGLQAAPHVEDALSELASLAKAAAVDDVGNVSAALTRYREHSSSMLQYLQATQRLGGAIGAALGPRVQQALMQRKLVDDTMQAAALDVNYPLDQLARGFANAAQLQAELSSQVLSTLKIELTQRHQAAIFKRNLLLVLIPLLLGFLGLIMLRSIRQLLGPIAQIVDITERIAGGDLSHSIPLGRQDELGRVMVALDHMQARLRGLVTGIQGGASSIRMAAQEIAAGNQNLASRTEEAAAQLQTTSSNVTQLKQTVANSSRSATEATVLARTASDLAGNGGAVVEQVASTVISIHQASKRIADITGMIDGIAFQTNILALNAAVEAARAGEQGRGFAVVAAEVRQLAGRSAEAAKEIKLLIQSSVERVESGSQLAAQAGSSMQQIVGMVVEMTEVIHSMEEQTLAQADQTSDLSQAVLSIDRMTQQNAALVEQSAASTESLRNQAEQMDAAVQAFKL